MFDRCCLLIFLLSQDGIYDKNCEWLAGLCAQVGQAWSIWRVLLRTACRLSTILSKEFPLTLKMATYRANLFGTTPTGMPLRWSIHARQITMIQFGPLDTCFALSNGRIPRCCPLTRLLQTSTLFHYFPRTLYQ